MGFLELDQFGHAQLDTRRREAISISREGSVQLHHLLLRAFIVHNTEANAHVYVPNIDSFPRQWSLTARANPAFQDNIAKVQRA